MKTSELINQRLNESAKQKCGLLLNSTFDSTSPFGSFSNRTRLPMQWLSFFTIFFTFARVLKPEKICGFGRTNGRDLASRPDAVGSNSCNKPSAGNNIYGINKDSFGEAGQTQRCSKGRGY